MVRAPTGAGFPRHRHADHFVYGLDHDGALRIGAAALPLHLVLLAVVVVVVTPTAAAAATAVVVAAAGLRRRRRRRRRARRPPLLLVPRRELLLGVVVVVGEALVRGVVAVVPAGAATPAVEHEALATSPLGARRVPGTPAAAPSAVAPEAPPRRRRPASDGHPAPPAVPDPVHLRSETCGADPRQITAASPDSDEHRRRPTDPGSSASVILANLAARPMIRRAEESSSALVALPPSLPLSALLLLLGAPPRFSSARCKALSALPFSTTPACLSFRLRAAAPFPSLGLGVVWPLPSPPGSLSRRPPHLIFFLSLRTPASDGPDPRSQRSRIRRPWSRGATVAHPATVGSCRAHPGRSIKSPPRSLCPLPYGASMGRNRHVAVSDGRGKSKRPPAVGGGGWGTGRGTRRH